MTIQEQLQHDMKDAMRNREQQRLDTIRMLIAALKNARIAQGKDLDEASEMIVLQKEAKQRLDSASEYRKVNRAELAEQEDAERAIIETYLPIMLTEAELRPQIQAIIQQVGAQGMADMAKVMPVVMSTFRGKADGRLLSQVVRELLSA